MSDESPRKTSVLFVDDDPLVLNAIVRLFRGHRQIAAHAAATPEGAMRALDATAFDIVVSDLRMPGVDGVDLLHHVRMRHPGVARVLLSAWVDRPQLVRAHDHAAADAILAKPFDEQRLERTLLDLARGRDAVLE
jgi:DNA-binding NarL/FixJ family response regulator